MAPHFRQISMWRLVTEYLAIPLMKVFTRTIDLHPVRPDKGKVQSRIQIRMQIHKAFRAFPVSRIQGSVVFRGMNPPGKIREPRNAVWFLAFQNAKRPFSEVCHNRFPFE